MPVQHTASVIALFVGISIGLGNCAPRTSSPTDTPTETSSETVNATPPASEQVAIQVDEFTIDEVMGAGCSMALMRTDDAPEDRTYIFFNPMQPENTMQMKLNGEMQVFARTHGVGTEFYGQFESQTFVNEETETTVQVDVQESPVIQLDEGFGVEGTLRIIRSNQEETLNVKGSAGC